jgi:hypothetical protein
MRQGDDAGPMAEAGFKGHPLCRFCHKRYFDNDDLYKHMEGQHEHCFICRRNNPNRFVYFKDYAEMEGKWGLGVKWGFEGKFIFWSWRGRERGRRRTYAEMENERALGMEGGKGMQRE